jgi:hypothetical protein
VKLSTDKKARSRKASRVAPLSLYDHFEAAVDHALPVKGHRVYVGLEARIGHDFLHGLVPHVARWPDDPREDDCFIILAFDSLGLSRTGPVACSVSGLLI